VAGGCYAHAPALRGNHDAEAGESPFFGLVKLNMCLCSFGRQFAMLRLLGERDRGGVRVVTAWMARPKLLGWNEATVDTAATIDSCYRCHVFYMSVTWKEQRVGAPSALVSGEPGRGRGLRQNYGRACKSERRDTFSREDINCVLASFDGAI
jgi:hypothetical protein